jgi:hypothetical protein
VVLSGFLFNFPGNELVKWLSSANQYCPTEERGHYFDYRQISRGADNGASVCGHLHEYSGLKTKIRLNRVALTCSFPFMSQDRPTDNGE